MYSFLHACPHILSYQYPTKRKGTFSGFLTVRSHQIRTSLYLASSSDPRLSPPLRGGVAALTKRTGWPRPNAAPRAHTGHGQSSQSRLCPAAGDRGKPCQGLCFPSRLASPFSAGWLSTILRIFSPSKGLPFQLEAFLGFLSTLGAAYYRWVQM